jgi:hypothetical protein
MSDIVPASTTAPGLTGQYIYVFRVYLSGKKPLPGLSAVAGDLLRSVRAMNESNQAQCSSPTTDLAVLVNGILSEAQLDELRRDIECSLDKHKVKYNAFDLIHAEQVQPISQQE